MATRYPVTIGIDCSSINRADLVAVDFNAAKHGARQETIARGGEVIFISDEEGVSRFGGNAAYAIALPKVHPFVTPLLYSIPVQLLAYHTAVLKGTDVDQPRNLAKSVTVE